jgi:hypothetical protein
MDGPGDVRWIARHIEESLAPRPRKVTHWIPDDSARLPDAIG